MIFVEKTFEDWGKIVDGKVPYLTWDRADMSLLGEYSSSDVKSIEFKLEAGDMGRMTVELYEKGNLPNTITEKFVVGFNPDLRLPIFRIRREKDDENQLQFNFEKSE